MQTFIVPTGMTIAREIADSTPTSETTGSNISAEHSEVVYAVLAKINRQKAQLLAPVILFTVVMMIIGVVGNPVALYIYGWRWQNSTTRIFLFWLAVVDLINCIITMPTEIYIMTNFFYFPNAEVCRVSRFLTYVTNNSSAAVFVAIAIDRYIRICHPHRRTISVFGARVACGLSSCIGVGVSWPALLLYGRKKVPMTHPGINGSFSGILCDVKNEMDNTPYPLGYFIYLWCGFSACVLILFMIYVLIGRVMLRRNRRKSVRSRVKISYMNTRIGEERTLKDVTYEMSTTYSDNNTNSSDFTNSFNCAGSNRKQKRNTPPKSTLMLFAITAVFLITFLPFLVVMTTRQQIGPLFYPSLSAGQQVMVHLFARSYLVNNCANPIVYGMCNSGFRDQLKKLFHISGQGQSSLTRDISRTTRGLTI